MVAEIIYFIFEMKPHRPKRLHLENISFNFHSFGNYFISNSFSNFQWYKMLSFMNHECQWKGYRTFWRWVFFFLAPTFWHRVFWRRRFSTECFGGKNFWRRCVLALSVLAHNLFGAKSLFSQITKSHWLTTYPHVFDLLFSLLAATIYYS